MAKSECIASVPSTPRNQYGLGMSYVWLGGLTLGPNTVSTYCLLLAEVFFLLWFRDVAARVEASGSYDKSSKVAFPVEGPIQEQLVPSPRGLLR